MERSIIADDAPFYLKIISFTIEFSKAAFNFSRMFCFRKLSSILQVEFFTLINNTPFENRSIVVDADIVSPTTLFQTCNVLYC